MRPLSATSSWVSRRSVRQQIVLLTATLTAFGMLLLAVVLQLVLASQSRRDVDRVLEDRADAVISSIDDSGPNLAVPDARLDADVAVYDEGGTLVVGRVPMPLSTSYGALSTSGTRTLRSVGGAFRILAIPFTTSTGQEGVVVVAERLEPYEEAERLALIISLVAGLVTTAAAAAAAAWATTRALRQVSQMAATADDWSEHDLGRRFDLGSPSNEISALAATLDALLDKVSAAIESEQRLTSELAHELRTPLTTVQGTADLMLLRGDLPQQEREDVAEIAAAGRRMSATMAALLDLARQATSLVEASRSTLTEVLAEVARDVPAHPPLLVQVDDVRIALPLQLAVRTLAPVLTNAVQHATSQVRVTTRRSGSGQVEVVVEDDGAGIEPGRRDAVFEPGSTTGSGAGLGLALARRIARSVGGDIVLDATAPGAPTTFVVRLPLA